VPGNRAALTGVGGVTLVGVVVVVVVLGSGGGGGGGGEEEGGRLTALGLTPSPTEAV